MTFDSQKPPQSAVRVMHLRRPYLDLVASGAKTVEVRVTYPNRRDLAPGQLIRFQAEGAHVLTRVTRVSRYASFEEMLDHEDVAAISGVPESREELLTAIRSIYDETKESLGVITLEVHVVTSES
ncbi:MULTISPECIES: ASCH domain-containing protein [unclassified Kitasatospora]|uniref:ASCH domain-containing protein n=1 Tax=unclassified Kitasatospora TaxID=2633591 RepID=UPI002473274D|nr:ASCH domain-containing protein [Kitasatospora sp. MAP12-44]